MTKAYALNVFPLSPRFEPGPPDAQRVSVDTVHVLASEGEDIEHEAMGLLHAAELENVQPTHLLLGQRAAICLYAHAQSRATNHSVLSAMDSERGLTVLGLRVIADPTADPMAVRLGYSDITQPLRLADVAASVTACRETAPNLHDRARYLDETIARLQLLRVRLDAELERQ